MPKLWRWWRHNESLNERQKARDEAREALKHEHLRQEGLAARVKEIEANVRPLLEQVRFLQERRREGREM